MSSIAETPNEKPRATTTDISAKKPELRVDWADSKAARFACVHWHYSRTYPPGAYNIVGAWEDGAFIGVVMFARGASPKLGPSLGVQPKECCELVRVALRAHRTPVTRIVRIALKMLRRRSPGIKLVVSFADTNQGHHGGIYQGGGWLYTGTTAPSKVYVDATGRQWHPRQITVSGFGTEFGKRIRCKKRSEVREVQLLGKHRYLMAFDEDLKKKLQTLSKPYPKRQSLAPASSSADTLQASEVLQAQAAYQPSGDDLRVDLDAPS